MSTVRHDWYQSDSKIVITVLLKNAQEKNFKVNIDKEKVVLTADDYSLELNLFRPIDPERSSYKATPTKVEIILGKVTAERWENLQKKELQLQTNAEPKLRRYKWDRIAQEIAEEEKKAAEGEEALQNLFRQIYNDSDENVKRAMNKSFSESGGTVLSTNWKEVGEKKVDVKPPQGTEFKKWDG